MKDVKIIYLRELNKNEYIRVTSFIVGTEIILTVSDLYDKLRHIYKNTESTVPHCFQTNQQSWRMLMHRNVCG